jgi:RNA polymerase primary sigma factor
MMVCDEVAGDTAASADPDVEREPRAPSTPRAFDEPIESQIYRHWRRGTSVAVLAMQHGLPAPTVEQMIDRMRAAAVLAKTCDLVYAPCFEAPDADAMILAPMPECARNASRPKPPAGLSPYIANLYSDGPLLNRQQEHHLFRKMNYLKYRAVKLRETLEPLRARASDLDEIERLQAEALAVKNQIVRANLRLVVSIAKKHATPINNLFELVSDGNMCLIRAVEKFDFDRGFRFSTYASSAIIKEFARAIPAENKRRHRFVSGSAEVFAAIADYRAGEHQDESDNRCDRQELERALRRLDWRERRILVGRFGLDGNRALTLQQLGCELGISRERVRQVERRAKEKLRQFATTATDLFSLS